MHVVNDKEESLGFLWLVAQEQSASHIKNANAAKATSDRRTTGALCVCNHWLLEIRLTQREEEEEESEGLDRFAHKIPQ